MRNTLPLRIVLILLVCTAQSGKTIIIRHDTNVADHIALAERYPAVCHFPDGEGTLIDTEWVVTAAHVALGLRRVQERGQSVTVMCAGMIYHIDTIVVHPEFRPINHDIALVRLQNPVKSVTPVPVCTSVDPGAMITIVGRGDFGTGLTGPVSMDKILRAATNLIDGLDEQWLWFDFDNPFAADVTALEGVSGPGDSGGPAFVDQYGKTYLAGISSHQRSDGKPGRYGAVEYYTRVTQYIAWINEVKS